VRSVIAIVIAGALIAAAIAIVGRWEFTFGRADVYRLDRWTGRSVVCYANTNADTGIPARGAEFICEPR
jgi:hypothetical protein